MNGRTPPSPTGSPAYFLNKLENFYTTAKEGLNASMQEAHELAEQRQQEAMLRAEAKEEAREELNKEKEAKNSSYEEINEIADKEDYQEILGRQLGDYTGYQGVFFQSHEYRELYEKELQSTPKPRG